MTEPIRKDPATAGRAASLFLRALKRTFPKDVDRRCL